jgi:hypothetical protein
VPSSDFSSWKASCEEGLDGIFSAGRCSGDYREKCTAATISISYYHGSCDLGEFEKSMQYACDSQSGDWVVRK